MLVKNWFHRFAYAGCLPSDTESERLRKAILVSIPTGISLLSVFWVSGYLVLGRPLSAAIPGGYAVFSLLSVLVFFKTKHYGFFRFSQLFLMLWLPFLLQWSLGGFNSGSVVMIWAILSPIGALMFHGVRQAIPWFLAYLALTVVSGAFDSQLALAVPPLPSAVISVFYVMNIGCASLLMYAVVNYFVVENKRIIAALSEEKAKTEKALADAERATATIEEQANKLMEMDRIKTRFFANISHEFRTPLTLIIGPLEDCLAGSAKPPLSQLEAMLRNCRLLLRLINQLLDIAKLEAAGMKLTTKRGNLTQFLDGIVRSFTPSAERSGIRLQAGADDGDVIFYFDAEKLEKVFSNLLSNALKFTPQGGKVHIRSVVADSHDEKSVKITVRDTGHGIPKQELPYIFDRFRQVDGSSTRAHEGTGIGLALVKDLVSLHGGRIDVVSEPGFGTEFTVTLPYRLDPPEGAERETADEEMAMEPEILTDNLKSELAGLEQHHLSQRSDDSSPSTPRSVEAQADKGTILVIDDNPDIRSYLVDCLTPHYSVIQAKDGVDGLRLAQDTRPDLIICDIMMPRMDGYDVCRALKADERLNHIPLVFLTAKASSAMKVEGLKTGADDYIAKPFNARELLARAGNLITMRRQERELKTLNKRLDEKVKEQLETILKGKRLTRYLSKKLLDRILSSDEAPVLASERRKITIFFSDLCNFTDLVDSTQPEVVGQILNEYLSEMMLLIAREGATLVQVIGDGIMVFFGAPDPMDGQDQANNAMKMAVAMQRRMRQLSKKWLNEGLEQNVAVRMGIHQDYLTVGNFGCEEFMEYTAVGKGITLASRLESSCTPGNIKVSYPIYALTRERFPYDDLREEQFKGMARPLQVCELNPDRVVA
jgi:adenylate cyclase